MSSSKDSLIKVAKYSLENSKTFCLNLGAEFLVEIFNGQMMEAIQYSDIVFGNDAEVLKLSQVCKWNSADISEIAVLISKMPFKKTNKSRIVVITQGADPTIIVHEGKVKYYIILFTTFFVMGFSVDIFKLLIISLVY